MVVRKWRWNGGMGVTVKEELSEVEAARRVSDRLLAVVFIF